MWSADLLGRPLVHRRALDRTATLVVLQQQVLHGRSPLVWCGPFWPRSPLGRSRGRVLDIASTVDRTSWGRDGDGDQADDPDRRRRPGGLRGDHAGPARPVRRATTGSSGRRPGPRRSRCSTELALRDRPVALIASDQRMPEMTGHRGPRAGPARTRRTPSWCCSPRTPTPTSRSRPSTTSASTTTCSSRGTRPRSGSTRCSTTCSATGGSAHPDQTRRGAGRRPPVVGAERTRSRCSWPTTTCPYRWFDVERDDEAQRLRRAGPGRAPTTCRWCWCPTGDRCARRRPVELADALGLRTRAEQPLYDLCIVGGGPGRPGGRGVRRLGGAAAPWWSSARRRAGRPGRARRSRTTWASPRACPAPT